TVPAMNLRWILGLSVAMTALLLLALQLQRTEPARPSSLSPTATASPPEFSRSAGDPGSTMSSGEKIERKKARAATARQSLETDDYPLFVKKLRAAGLSEDTIATLLVAELRDRSIEDSVTLRRKFNRGELTQEDFDK